MFKEPENSVEQADEQIRRPDALVLQDPQSVEWQDAEAIEADVFLDCNYIESAPELAEEYSKYLPQSEFILISKEGEPAGSMRFINYDPSIGFKTIDDAEKGRLELSDEGRNILTQLPLDRTVEVGTMAVKREFRASPDDSGRVASMLYATGFSEAKKRGVDYLLASFDDEFFGRFSGIFGDGCVALGPPTDYMGSKTTPAVMDISKMRAHMEKTMPGAFDAIVQAADAMR